MSGRGDARAAEERRKAVSRSGYALLREACRPHRTTIAIGVVAGLFWTAAKVAVPKATQHAIDKGIIGNNGRGSTHDLELLTGVIILVGLCSGCCTAIRRYSAFAAAMRVETDLRQRLFAHLQRLHFAFHDQAQTGQLMSRAATDLQQVQSFIVLVPITISNVMTFLSVTVILLLINVKLALLALGALPLIQIAATRFSHKIYPVSMQLQQELAGVATLVEETVTGIRVVKGFGAEEMQAERMRAKTASVLGRSLEAGRIRALFVPILDLVPIIGLVAVLFYGGHQVLGGRLSVGELIEFNSYVVLLIVPLRMTGMLIAQAQRAVVSAQRIAEILDTDPVIVDRAGAGALPAATPDSPGLGEVRYEGVRFSYATSEGAVDVLDGFDLTIRPGEAVAIVGATGSGKTTVARLLPRFYDVQAGTVRIDGVDVRDIRVADLRRSIGIVFEDTFLFGDTVRANIAFADPQADLSRLRWAAGLAGADEFISQLPEGYDTELGERGFSLSGGQRQRIALARAIIADPRILILDDATSSVDPTKEHEIRGALAEVMRGRTTIVIAHRPATIALADRVVLLHGGRIVAEGTHDELLATNELYREVLARADQDPDAEPAGVSA